MAKIVGDDGTVITLDDGTRIAKHGLSPDMLSRLGASPEGTVTGSPATPPVLSAMDQLRNPSGPHALADFGKNFEAQNATAAAATTVDPVQQMMQAQATQPQMQPSQQAPQPQGMVPMQKQVQFTSGVKQDPKLVAEQEKIADKQGDALMAQASADAETARAEAALMGNVANDEEQKLREFQVKEMERQKQVEDSFKHFQDSAFKASSFKMNPNRFWEKAGPGAMIAGALARALGAFGSALTKTPNEAGAIIDAAIERDIRAQENEYKALQDNVDTQRNAYAYMRQQGLDAKDAFLGAKLARYDSVKAKIQALTAGKKSDQILANAQNALLAIDAQQNAIRQQAYANAQGKVTSNTVMAPAGGGGMSVTDLKGLTEIAENNPYLKEWRAARSAANRFNALVSAKAEGAAVMDFIGTGMKQGSFSPTFIDMLKKRGFIDSAGEAMRSKFMGGYDPKLLKELQSGLDSVMAEAGKNAAPVVRQLQAVGLPASFIVGGNTEREAAQQLGGVRK
jgi:hypothetical protein